jgi:hypothetical protein
VLQLLFTGRNQKRCKIIRYIFYFEKFTLLAFKKTISGSKIPPFFGQGGEK